MTHLKLRGTKGIGTDPM